MTTTTKKKLCILQNGFMYGGTDTFVLNLCRKINKEKYDVTVILAGRDGYFDRLTELEKTGVNIRYTCDVSGFKGKLRHFRMLYKILKQEKCDIFQTNIDLFNGPQMLVSWLAGVPIRVCHSHNSEQVRSLEEGDTFAIRIYQKIMRHLCWKYSNRRCGCSEAALDFLFGDKWKSDPKARVIHNGIPLEDYQSTFDSDEMKSALGIHKKYVIGTVGRISYQKNPEFIVEVFMELCSLRNDCEFLWAGGGDLFDEISVKVKDYGLEDDMKLLGARSDVCDLLKCFDVFLLPSRFEGLGIVLIEAQAAGLPCIASDVVPKEADCGGCTFVSLNESPKKWAEAVSDCLDGKNKFHINDEMLNEYSIEYMVEEMERVFDCE